MSDQHAMESVIGMGWNTQAARLWFLAACAAFDLAEEIAQRVLSICPCKASWEEPALEKLAADEYEGVRGTVAETVRRQNS